MTAQGRLCWMKSLHEVFWPNVNPVTTSNLTMILIFYVVTLTLLGGLPTKRLRWKLEAESKQAHLFETAQSDLFLDTMRVNAVWTAFDMLWAGLPVLTVSGEKMGSRVGASLLRSAGLGGDILSQGSLKEYEEAAIELATLSLASLNPAPYSQRSF